MRNGFIIGDLHKWIYLPKIGSNRGAYLVILKKKILSGTIIILLKLLLGTFDGILEQRYVKFYTNNTA